MWLKEIFSIDLWGVAKYINWTKRQLSKEKFESEEKNKFEVQYWKYLSKKQFKNETNRVSDRIVRSR